MKVLWIVSNFPTENDKFAGLFYKRMAYGIAELGINVTVISPRPIKRLKDIWRALFSSLFIYQDRWVTVYKPYYIPIPFALIKRFRHILIEISIRRCVRQIGAKYSLVHSFYAFPWGYVGMNISMELKIPMILTCVGSDIHTDIFSSAYVRKCVAEVLNCSRVISVNEELKKIMIENFILRDKIRVIYDGLDFGKFPDLRNTIQSDNIVIGFVGELCLQKGCDVLIEMIQMLGPKIEWKIVGNGPFRENFQKFKNVSLLGNLAPDAVLHFYQELSLFVFPSKREGIPNVLKEAAYYCVPIIASGLPGIVELTDDGRLANLVPDYNNAASFVKAVERSIINLDHERVKAKRLKEYVVDKFSLDISAQLIVNEYESVSSQKP